MGYAFGAAVVQRFSAWLYMLSEGVKTHKLLRLRNVYKTTAAISDLALHTKKRDRDRRGRKGIFWIYINFLLRIIKPGRSGKP